VAREDLDGRVQDLALAHRTGQPPSPFGRTLIIL
jgi:hypothetical protein